MGLDQYIFKTKDQELKSDFYYWSVDSDVRDRMEQVLYWRKFWPLQHIISRYIEARHPGEDPNCFYLELTEDDLLMVMLELEIDRSGLDHEYEAWELERETCLWDAVEALDEGYRVFYHGNW